MLKNKEFNMLETNQMAPDFTLPDQNGNDVTLSSFRGKKVILYFYPKDNTPGCTKEACSLNEAKEDLSGLNAVIIGVSRDSAQSHQKFIASHGLSFTLLTDKDHEVMEMYGAYGKKMMYGKETTGVIRTTYIIDEEGKIVKIFRKVNTATHGEDIKAFLEEA